MSKLSLAALALVLAAGCSGPNNGTHTRTPDGGADTRVPPDMGGGSDAAADMAVEGDQGTPEDPFDALADEVTMYRDSDGIMHIFASNQDDLFFANGYAMARDRFPQMEFYRRVSTGTLSEVVGSLSDSAIDVDVLFRMLGLKRSAERYWREELPADAESRRVVEAFTAGVNAYLWQYRTGAVTQPAVIQEAFSPQNTRDWEASDTAAIGKLLAVSLTYAADIYIDAHEFRQATADLFGAPGASPEYAKRALMFGDVVRNAPPSDATHIDGFPDGDTMALRQLVQAPRISPELLRNARDLHRAFEGDPLFESLNPLTGRDRYSRGSNNWVVAGALTESGFPAVANDPHLDLSTPTVFYPVHLHQTEGDRPYRMIGAAYVGAPGIVIGRTERVAWGTTVGFYDYVDVYQEQVTGRSDEAATVAFEGGEVPIERITETINVGNFGAIRDSFELDIEWVPHHGPIIPQLADGRPVVRESGEALSVKWVGLEASNELEFLVGLWRAETVADVEVALDNYEVGSSNFVFGFTSGDIFYSGQSKIPVRDAGALTYHPRDNPMGNAPFFVLPGDGTAEWTGYIPEEKIPHAVNPDKNYIITANNDPVGTTLDNDTVNDEYYLAGFFAGGIRAERIEERITNATGERPADTKLTPQMHVEIQDDGWDKLASRFAPFFVTAVDTVLDGTIDDSTYTDLGAIRGEISGREADLVALRDLLDGWNYSAPKSRTPTGDEATASAAETLFTVAMVYALRHTYGDELALVGRYDNGEWGIPRFGDIVPRSLLFLLEQPENALTWDDDTQDSALFDDLNTPELETRLTVLVRSLLDAQDRLGSSAPFGSRFGRDIPSPRSTDSGDWVWGNLHGLSLSPLLPFVGADWQRPASGLPFYERQGGQLAVTPCNHGFRNFDFVCGSGSSLRMVHDMDPAGPRTWNAVPGGTVADPTSPFFDNQMEMWQGGAPTLMRWDRAEIEAAAVTTETLPPE